MTSPAKSTSSSDDFHLRLSEDDSPAKSAFQSNKEKPRDIEDVNMAVDTEKPPDNDLIQPEVSKKLLNGVADDNDNGGAVVNEVPVDVKPTVHQQDMIVSFEVKQETICDISNYSKEKPLPEAVASGTSDKEVSESDCADETRPDDMKVSRTDDEVEKTDNVEVSNSDDVAKAKANEVAKSDDVAASKPDDEESNGCGGNNKDSKLDDASQSSGPASVLRTTSVESEDQTSSTPPTRTEAEPIDEEDSSNSVNFMTRFTDERKKRPRVDIEGDLDYLSSGRKRIRLEKIHCSDGEQDKEDNEKNKVMKRKERRRSYSEAELMKDLKFYHRNDPVIPSALKNEKWKAPELTPEEKRRLELANAREKKMRENVLRVIQRNYKSMSVEDFEDGVYVAIMDYFCHYNADALLQRKVLMLEKLVSKLQDNYNRTFKQYCEAKYLLKRMVEIRKEDPKKCACKDKIPFKLVRSVAVQVQTARCRGGDLCPGSSIGLDPNFKSDASTSSKASTSSPRKPADAAQPSCSTDSNALNSNASKGSQPAASSPQKQPVGSRQVSGVSTPTLNGPQNVVVNQVPSAELPNGKVPLVVQTPSVQRTVLRQILPPQAVVKSSLVKPFSQTSAKPSPNSFVIDLTDKEEDAAGTSSEEVTSSLVAPSKNSPLSMQQPIQTRVVKTSVLSPMPQLPQLPSAPQYKSIVRRPPQPVLKVCKADQSGIMLSWTLRSNVPLANEIMVYQVYACQENAGVSREWSSVGNVKALPLPMACTLSQFREGHRYHFVVRAVDKFNILGEFSHPASILLVSKNGPNSSSPNSTNQQQSASPPPTQKPVQRPWPVNSRRGR